MLGRTELWKILETLVAELGVQLFDVEMPKGPSGRLRIFIDKAGRGGAESDSQHDQGREGEQDREGGITHEDCANLSRRLSAHPQVQDLLERYSLEVSSPGVNRRLRLPQHFAGAVGEHIFVKVREGNGVAQTLRGVLDQYNAEELVLRTDGENERRTFCLDDVLEARVDFVFQ